MADNVIELKVVVDQDTGGLNVVGQNLDKVGQTAAGTEKAFLGLSGQTAVLARNLLGFASAGAVLAFFKSAIDEAEKENQALNRLRFALEATGQSWTQNAKQVQEWGAAIQKTTRFSDTEAFETVSRLARVTHDLAQAQRASQIAMGLSVISGKDLATTTEQVAMLASGQERAVMQLRREYGSLIGNAKTTQEVMDALAKATGKAAFAEDSLTKNTNQLKAAYSDLQEQIGRGLAPAFTTLISWAGNLLKAFQTLAQGVATYWAAIFTAITGTFAAIQKASAFHFREAAMELQQMRLKMKLVLEGSADDFKAIWEKNSRAEQKAMQDSTRVFVRETAEQEAKAKEMNERILKNEMDTLEKKYKADHEYQENFKKEISQTMDHFVKSTSDAFAKAIVEGEDFGEAMQKVFVNMMEQFISAVTEMMIKWAAFQALTGGAGGFGGGMFGGMFAKGVDTIVDKPTFFMAGEAGPERLTISPVAGSDGGGSGGGRGGAMHVTIGDINVRVAVDNLDSANTQRILDAMAREIRAKAGAAVRFSLASQALAEQNSGRTF